MELEPGGSCVGFCLTKLKNVVFEYINSFYRVFVKMVGTAMDD